MNISDMSSGFMIPKRDKKKQLNKAASMVKDDPALRTAF